MERARRRIRISRAISANPKTIYVSLSRKIVLWLKWNRVGMSLRSRGVLGTVSHILERIAERGFDTMHSLETTAKIPADALGIEGAKEYTPVPVIGLSRLLAELGKAIDYSAWDFVDLGCGKGRAMFVASRFAFQRIIGVELSTELVRIAKRNIRKYRDGKQKCFDLTVVQADARSYQLSGTSVVLYLFDPFEARVMEKVLNNVSEWLKSGEHGLYVIYWHPRSAETFKRLSVLELMRATPEYCLYRGAIALSTCQ